MMSKSTLLALLATIGADAFIPSTTSARSLTQNKDAATSLSFGIPSFFTTPEPDEDDDTEVPKKEISMKGLIQLITAGAGSPFLGDFEGIDEETGNFMFSLEANNLADENGESKQTKMPYFESGWVDEEEESKKGEGFKFPWSK